MNFICGFYAENGRHCVDPKTNRCDVCNKIITTDVE